MGNWSKQAKAALSQRDYTQAGDFFKLDGNYKAAVKAYVSGKNFGEAARIYEGMGQFAKAEKLLLKDGSAKDLAEFHVRNQSYEKALAAYTNHGMDYEAAELLEKLNRQVEAANLYAKLGFHEKAGVLFGKSRRFDDAIRMISKVIDGLAKQETVPLAKSKILKYQNWIANFHIGAKRFSAAGEIFLEHDNKEKAAKCFMKGGQALRAAEILLDLGKLEMAEKVLGTVQDLQARVMLAKICNARGEFERTLILLQDTNQPQLLSEAYENLGDFLKAAGEEEKLGNLRKAARLFQKGGEYRKAAMLFEQDGQYREAAECYEKLKKYGHAAKLYHMARDRYKAGLCLHRYGRSEDALKQLQMVEENHPNVMDAKKIMAEIFFKQGVFPLARRLLDEITADSPVDDSSMASFYFLARCLEQENNLEVAKKYYERIAAKKFNYADVTERLKRLHHIQAAQTGKFSLATPVKKKKNFNPFNLKEGDVIDERFEVQGTIGKGGMGTIFKVRDLSLSRNIALKMLSHRKADFEELKVELLMARDLTHPYIIKVFDVGQWHDIGYFTMEYVDGKPLKKFIHDKAGDPLTDKVRLMVKICEGLKAAHDQDVVHRDIKPQNIIVDKDYNPKILDFGIARKVTQQSRSISGSPKYMAPEQIQNTGTDVRTDIYALGIIMFYMFTLREPFIAKTPQEVMQMHLHQPLPDPLEVNPSVPYWLCDIIRKCCQKKPDVRFGDMGELIDELKLNLMEF
ncbi:MAG: protein kinase [Acidobacteriota bacterium]|nr:protein kinase [Acidobacteriota bacterium]